uniref:Uncharacterized protein n=1 Tax=Anguilla anguilla TaxID=7936 RepID=A0A0E9PDX5_ANGAN
MLSGTCTESACPPVPTRSR